MLNKRRADFCMIVWRAAKDIGNSAPKITNAIIREAFPRTCVEAEHEGADKMLRTGVIAAVKEVLRGDDPAYEQLDFSAILPQFHPLVRALKSRTYTVPSTGEYIPVHLLIAEPALLDEARRFMRKKGHECLEEADRLDKLYFAVLAPR